MTKCNCGCNEYVTRPYLVRSCGPHTYCVDYLPYCDEKLGRFIRGDGHSYAGSFVTEEEAEEHGSFMSND